MPRLPRGFLLGVEFLSLEEEEGYLDLFAKVAFETVSMRGREVRRQLLAYGVGFGTNFQSTTLAAPIPPELQELRRRATEWAAASETGFTQALIQRYPPGATIGWHRDAELFGSPIIGISFGGPARMRFRKQATDLAVMIPGRSIYVLSDDCRWKWLHAISAVPELRYSITFRTITTSSCSLNS